ncbi:MAG: D-2-hydroxyacid dehydrogenase [Dehalococcoidia bacterium]|nr:D-2-hydroxyacid dehydrogenase [Dehalococcoidia bacterium]
MKQRTLVLGTRLSISDATIERIRRDHPALRVVDASADWTLVAGFKTIPPVAGAAWEAASQRLNKSLAEAEIIYSLQYIPLDLKAHAPKLRWIHFGGTGIDLTQGSDIHDGSLLLTNSRGALAVPIAEWVVTLMLMLAKQTRALEENQRRKRWERRDVGDLAGRTIGVLGLGNIGSATARLCKAFGMRVLATRRSCARRGPGDDGFTDEMFPPDQLHEMLAQCDFVAITLPSTPETRHIIGERELRALKPTAYIVNVGRGSLIDEPALIRALQEGRIVGAGLDVFEEEPPAPDNPLWSMPNVIVTPHMAGATVSHDDLVAAILLDNIRRYMAGEPLRNPVRPDMGY